jgi:Fe-S-cluster containining protein
MEAGNLSGENIQRMAEEQRAVGFLAEYSKNMVVTAILEEKKPEVASGLIKEIYDVLDEVISGCLGSGTKLPCTKGCCWCCFLRVKVTPMELVCILDYLRSNQKSGDLSDLRQRVKTADQITRGLDGFQRLSAKELCPLIRGGECLVYPVRPIMCRTYHSLNNVDCKLLLNDGRRSLKIRQDISWIGMGMFAGLTEGLRAVGLRTQLLELNAGLVVAFDDPASVMKWLAGDPVFSAAEIENSDEIERFHQKLFEKLGVSSNGL